MPSEIRTILGFVLLIMAASLFPFVMVGLLGFVLLPAALVFLIWAVAEPRGPGVAWAKAALGMILALAGIALLCFAAGNVALLEQNAVLSVRRAGAYPAPTMQDWLITAGAAVGASILVPLGLMLRSGKARPVLVLWATGCWIIGPIVYLIFSALATILPLDA